MMTIRDFAAKRNVTIQTVYSWIYRNQSERFGFVVHQIGKVKLIEEIKAKKKARV
jgi:hypothetical protein